ncbi:MAG: hypothetical protein VX619_11360 [bacterium]|nr:hypothetical protein [bacterium]
MKNLLTYLLIISQTHNCFARSNTPDLNLHNDSQIKVARKTYIDNLKKCKLLLKSSHPKSVYTEALKYVLKHRMPSAEIFEQLENTSTNDSTIRLEIAQLVTKQSLKLQNLIRLANESDILKFNNTSHSMLKLFDSIEKLLHQINGIKKLRI